MKNLSLTAVTLIAFALTGLSYADPDRPGRIHEKIRKEYREAATPNHIMFAFTLFSIKATHESDHDMALRLVQTHMHLDSGDAAEAFLSRLVAAATELKSEWAKVFDEMLCGQTAPRSKEPMYAALDRVDDLRENKSHNAYIKFISGLDESHRGAMNAWLEADKEGFYYRAVEHKSMYERTGTDAVVHIDSICALRRARR